MLKVLCVCVLFGVGLVDRRLCSAVVICRGVIHCQFLRNFKLSIPNQYENFLSHGRRKTIYSSSASSDIVLEFLPVQSSLNSTEHPRSRRAPWPTSPHLSPCAAIARRMGASTPTSRNLGCRHPNKLPNKTKHSIKSQWDEGGGHSKFGVADNGVSDSDAALALNSSIGRVREEGPQYRRYSASGNNSLWIFFESQGIVCGEGTSTREAKALPERYRGCGE